MMYGVNGDELQRGETEGTSQVNVHSGTNA